MEGLQIKAAQLLKTIDERRKELEHSTPAARAAAICLKHGIPLHSLNRAQLEGSTIKLANRTTTLSEKEVLMLKPWIGSKQGSRTVVYHTCKALKDMRLKFYNIYLMKKIADNQSPVIYL